MKKIIHLTIHSFLLTALFFFGCFMLDSCGKKQREVDGLEESGDRLEQLTEELSSEEFFEDGDVVDYADKDRDMQSNSVSEETSSDDSVVEADVDYIAPSDRTQSKSITGRSFMIVAGNYLVESNANEMVRKLKKKGYDDAEKVVFDLSQYYTVIAARYDNRSSADQSSQHLKNEGFDNYVLGSK